MREWMNRQKKEMNRQALVYEKQLSMYKQQIEQMNERERLRVETIKARVRLNDKMLILDDNCSKWITESIKNISNDESWKSIDVRNRIVVMIWMLETNDTLPSLIWINYYY